MREKQIEEMARIICGLCTKEGCLCDGGYCNFNCHDYERAKRLYNAGYRKQSEVAREIFAVTDILGTYNPAMYDELKKKYAGADEKPFPRDHENGCEYCKTGEEKCGTCVFLLDYFSDGGSDKCSAASNEEKCNGYKPMNFCPYCGRNLKGE